MEKTPDRLDSMLGKLRQTGFRMTPQRLAILKILAESNGHPGAEQIHAAVRKNFPTTTIATVYKTLAVLKSIGEVLEIEFSGDYNRYDGKKPYSHPHLICIKCKKIVDPELASLADMTEKLALESGYELITHRLDFYGICPQCRKRNSGV
ncbi:MAG TPA: Fur family transcriptional regulator [Syntrophobacteraceae bacterium]|nr:Fur family transcriptional regulator [Syntrophobacteraceae bacterium]